jgi:hypothetical protein
MASPHVSQPAFRPTSQMASPHVSQPTCHPAAQVAFRPCLEITSHHMSKSTRVAIFEAHSTRNALATTQPVSKAESHAYKLNVSNSSYLCN